MVNVHSDIVYNERKSYLQRMKQRLLSLKRNTFERKQNSKHDNNSDDLTDIMSLVLSNTDNKRSLMQCLIYLETYNDKIEMNRDNRKHKERDYSGYLRTVAELIVNINDQISTKARIKLFEESLNQFPQMSSNHGSGDKNGKSKEDSHLKMKSLVSIQEESVNDVFKEVRKVLRHHKKIILRKRARRMTQSRFSFGGSIDPMALNESGNHNHHSNGGSGSASDHHGSNGDGVEFAQLTLGDNSNNDNYNNEVPFCRDILKDATKGRHVTNTFYNIFKYDYINIHELEQRCFNKSLTMMLPIMLSHLGYESNHTLFRFIDQVQNSHHHLPYHNGAHIADVLQTCFWWTSHIGQGKSQVLDLLTPVDVYSILIAASIHDIKHPGVGNIFLVQSDHEISQLYNDNHVLENFHLSFGLRLLKKQENNILKLHLSSQANHTRSDHQMNHLSMTSPVSAGEKSMDENSTQFEEGMDPEKEERQRFQKVLKNITECVLATSFGNQKNNKEELKKLIILREQLRHQGKTLKDLPKDDQDRIKRLIMRCIVHAADISHFSKRLELHKGWSERYYEEYIVEKHLGKKKNLPLGKSIASEQQWPIEQMWFIENLVIPFYDLFLEAIDMPMESQMIYDNLRSNLSYWKSNPITDYNSHTIINSSVNLATENTKHAASASFSSINRNNSSSYHSNSQRNHAASSRLRNAMSSFRQISYTTE